MAKVEQHPMNEYFLVTPPLVVAGGGSRVAMHVPVPAAGRVVRVMAACVAEPNAAIQIRILKNNLRLQSDGGDVLLALPDADLVGDVTVEEVDWNNERNYFMEPENGDLIAKGTVIEIRTDGAGTAGTYQFTFVIRH